MTTNTAPKLTIPAGERDHIQGPTQAPVTLLEYGDYECPYCGQAYYVVQHLEALFGEQLRVAFRHFPLTTIHPHSQTAAEAAEAAGGQGRFWEMHNVLFENQQSLEDEDLFEYAVDIGLDMNRFSLDMAEHRHAGRIREDVLSGTRSGVNGTPTFFINNVRYDGVYDAKSLGAAIAEVKARERKSVA
jgi:protein-disulfide isomerase